MMQFPQNITLYAIMRFWYSNGFSFHWNEMKWNRQQQTYSSLRMCSTVRDKISFRVFLLWIIFAFIAPFAWVYSPNHSHSSRKELSVGWQSWIFCWQWRKWRDCSKWRFWQTLLAQRGIRREVYLLPWWKWSGSIW